jgi:hypothetical protein
MKGDFSRNTFSKDKHYSAVLMQQGRVQVDADWNEQQAIIAHRTETEAIDVIGVCGAPKDAAGFEITADAGGRLWVDSGRYYVDGILCENPERVAIEAQPSKPDLPVVVDGTYVAYLDVWARHVTSLEDQAIAEVALGGADTATRVKTVWQVRLAKADDGATCKTLGNGWAPATGTAKLTARAEPSPPGKDDCLMPPGARYRRIENQLYRVEIHQGGRAGDATFKWSRDNGTVVTTISKVDGWKVTVASLGRDRASLGFENGRWVELIDEASELNGRPGSLYRITDIVADRREITLTPALIHPAPAPQQAPLARLRRWDSDGAVAVAAAEAGFVALEDGVEIKFDAGGEYRTGDYWLIPGRTATGDVEWPDGASLRPLGIEHHYCPVAIVKRSGGAWSTQIEDCRDLFPALTSITAGDVSYDKTACDLKADTVQQAIDELCAREHADECTFVVTPDNWKEVFERLSSKEVRNAHICFQVGDYNIENTTFRLLAKGHLVLSGAGFGTHIFASTEAVLQFEQCESVTVRDLYVESRVPSERKDSGRLGGALTFLDCSVVTVDSVRVACAGRPARAMSCISVGPSDKHEVNPKGASVRVRHSDLEVGFAQAGMLLVNCARAHVEDNTLRAARRPRDVTPQRLIEDRGVRAALRRMLISDVRIGAARAKESGVITVDAGDRNISFRTQPELVRPWRVVLDGDKLPVAEGRSAVVRHLVRLADRILLNPGDGRFRGFARWLEKASAATVSATSQGIVVGGRVAADVRIVDNTVDGAVQSVHVGVSHRGAATGPGAQAARDNAGVVLIARNTIRGGALLGARDRQHGIFVGNCDSLVVEENYVDVAPHPSMPSEGIRVFGELGRRMIVRQNHIVRASIAVYVRALNHGAKGKWLVADNLSEGGAYVLHPATEISNRDNAK